MAHRSARIRAKALGLAAALLVLPLSGCGGRLLSRRQIVRAAFLQRGAQWTVILLAADQQSEDSAACRTFAGSGDTCAAAWQQAEQAMPGQAFYGLMDLAVLPADASWQTVCRAGEQIAQTARPAPEIAMFAQGPTAPALTADEVPERYEALLALADTNALHCGLQELFADAETCAVPVCAEQGYTLRVWDVQSGQGFDLADPLTAQLAAILRGQAKRLVYTQAGNFSCTADVTFAVQPREAEHAEVRLRLHSAALRDLTDAQRTEAQLHAALEAAAQTAFDDLTRDLADTAGDALYLRFWQQNRYGPQAGTPAASLTVLW